MKCYKEEFKGKYCCNCINQMEVVCHPWNKTFAKGRMSERLGYVCISPDLFDTNEQRQAVFFDSEHGLCELWTPKSCMDTH